MLRIARSNLWSSYDFSSLHSFNTVEKCTQEYVFVPFEMKLAALYTLVRENSDKQVIIFCASKQYA